MVEKVDVQVHVIGFNTKPLPDCFSVISAGDNEADIIPPFYQLLCEVEDPQV